MGATRRGRGPPRRAARAPSPSRRAARAVAGTLLLALALAAPRAHALSTLHQHAELQRAAREHGNVLTGNPLPRPPPPRDAVLPRPALGRVRRAAGGDGGGGEALPRHAAQVCNAVREQVVLAVPCRLRGGRRVPFVPRRPRPRHDTL
ncbi:MAG: hypothetical protein J3K34DRAFT_411068 [Monoraphidium minutum]|nr:MAG: hypothetical protein J3K34DRAFT_411068 [Monoraphidium minutum]